METDAYFILKDNIKFHKWKGRINMTQSKLIYLLYWCSYRMVDAEIEKEGEILKKV